MKRGHRFTIYHAIAASIAIHAALAAPLALRWKPLPHHPEPLVVELQGVVSTSQNEEKVLQRTKGEETKQTTEAKRLEETKDTAALEKQQEAKEKTEAEEPEGIKDRAETASPQDAAQPPPQPAEAAPVEKETVHPSPAEKKSASAEPQPTEAKAGEAGLNNVAGAAEQQQARTIKAAPTTDRKLLRTYVALLSKKIHADLVYPDNARDARLQGVPVVSFTILPNGQIRPETLKIATSSGKPKLDAAALKTIVASAPFAPPPRELSVVIDVVFGEISGRQKGKS